MQVVIAVAGKSSRFVPFSDMGHKAMVTLLGRPILAHTIEGLSSVGMKDIVLIVGKESSVVDYFGDGATYGVSITYVVQEEPLGLGDGLLKAKAAIKDDFLVLNGTHIDIAEYIPAVKEKKADGLVFGVKKENPWEYGVIRLTDGRLEEIVEKPKKGEEPSDLCILGIYALSKEFLSVLEKTPVEHYQFEKALSTFAREKRIEVEKLTNKPRHESGARLISGPVTLKYAWDLFDLKDYLLSKISPSIASSAEIATSAEIDKNVVISPGAKIMGGAKIKGPAYIGKNAYVGDNSTVRNGSILEEGAVVGALMEIKNTILMKNVHTHSGYIGDSIVGEGAKIGGEFTTANVRLDRGSVTVEIDGKKIDSGKKSLGAFIGAGALIGIKASTMPGVIIGHGAHIGPSTVVLRNVAPKTKYYTKFQEVVEEKI